MLRALLTLFRRPPAPLPQPVRTPWPTPPASGEPVIPHINRTPQAGYIEHLEAFLETIDLDKVSACADKGMTLEDTAARLNIDEDIFRAYIGRYPDLAMNLSGCAWNAWVFMHERVGVFLIGKHFVEYPSPKIDEDSVEEALLIFLNASADIARCSWHDAVEFAQLADCDT